MVAEPSERKRVLVVDDEPGIVEVVQAYLQREGFETYASGSVGAARDVLERIRPDVMILDITLPDGSGFDVLREASKPGARTPTIMLTARGEEADRIVGLELGADDYVTKPFSPREVVARVRALLRLVEEASEAGKRHEPGKKLSVGEIEIDFDFHEVRIAGKPVPLTATEFKILAVLAENPGEVFTRAHLLDRMEDRGAIFERTLDRHINNLRKKIEADPHNPVHVVTVYGVGYKISKP